jgi:putative oxidoreductase
MKIATIIARGLLGLVFVVFGMNQFLHFIPLPVPPGQAGAFMGAMFATHYVYVVAAAQVAGGLLLFTRYVPLALTLLGPVIVNILTFHICMAPSGLPVASVVAVLALFLLWQYREHFAGLIKPVSRPEKAGVNSQAVAQRGAVVQ